jgi:hypothetical protein
MVHSWMLLSLDRKNTSLKSWLNEQEKVTYRRELPGEVLMSVTADGENEMNCPVCGHSLSFLLSVLSGTATGTQCTDLFLLGCINAFGAVRTHAGELHRAA